MQGNRAGCGLIWKEIAPPASLRISKCRPDIWGTAPMVFGPSSGDRQPSRRLPGCLRQSLPGALEDGSDDRGTGCTETVYVITWLDAAAASSGDLLLMNRGRRAVEGRVPRTLDNAATWNEGKRQIRGSMSTMARTASLNASCPGVDRLTSLHQCM